MVNKWGARGQQKKEEKMGGWKSYHSLSKKKLKEFDPKNIMWLSHHYQYQKWLIDYKGV